MAETDGKARATGAATAGGPLSGMRVVFMGTPDFAVPSLRALADAGAEVALAVTRPDAVRGRGRKLVASPVKEVALSLGVPVLEARRIDDAAFARVADAAPDVLVVAAYGAILPQRVLDLPRIDAVNVHASLLPRWRGAAPIARAILAGDERAGVSIMRLVAALDAGAYCAQASVEVGEKDAAALTVELAQLGARTLVDVLPGIVAGTAPWVEQDEALVTYAAKLTKQEMLLSPDMGAADLVRHVRASGDEEPARCCVLGQGVRVLAARVADMPGEAEAPARGEALVRKSGVLLGCADGAVEVLSVRPDGRRAMDGRAWAAGLRGRSGGWEGLA